MHKLFTMTVFSLGLAALAVPPASAQSGDPAGARSQDHRSMRHHEKRAFGINDRVEAKLAYLKTALKITDAQTPQWNAYADFRRNQAREMEERMKSRRARAGEKRGHREFTAIERIEFMQSRLAESLHRLNQLLEVEKPLYESLSPEQKKVADEVLAPHRHHRAESGFRHRGPRHDG